LIEAVEPTPLSAGDRWRVALKRAGTHSLVVWPPITIAWLFLIDLKRHTLALDFEHAYLPAARAVLDGHSPYPLVSVAQAFPRTAFVYPPLTAYLATPFTVLPPTAREVLASTLVILGVAGILRLLGVRDWRCYMIVFLWVPVYSAIQIANVTVLLTLVVAFVWRYRHKTAALALAVGFVLALKLFLWPLLVWLLATRRVRAAAGAVGVALALIVVPWAGIGFKGMGGYPHLLRVLARAEREDQYTIAAVLSRATSWRVAELVGIAVGIAVLALAVRAAKDERRSFVLSIAAALVISPLVEMHYFVLLLVVLALYRPRFGWVWAAPILLWVGPQVAHGVSWRTAAALGVAVAIFVLATRTDGSLPLARERLGRVGAP
jgi:hypothetical protein